MNALSEELLKIPILEHDLFADDSKVVTKARDKNTIELTLKLVVHRISKWTKQNPMEISASKTKYVFFDATLTGSLTLHANGVKLEEDHTTCLLRVDASPSSQSQQPRESQTPHRQVPLHQDKSSVCSGLGSQVRGATPTVQVSHTFETFIRCSSKAEYSHPHNNRQP
ncbi:hypothetical protein DQ04_05761050 [Trypanosoma grayi]|uniref:hypothetical protein n=1 Tax=Trypanosoma grayi TaxID=71804 RepID=UPI0004F4821C|nr:hypothetical protein DQ04_05761050 [Trypanosoma grayi]KEG09129.1 hypothetical protein DQ04_05761050 [Trypanosoma grayi]